MPGAASRRATRRTRRPSSSSAHEEAKQALAEIRDLARGIDPAVLTDRGLDAALSSPRRAAGARRPRPELGDERLPEQVESAAYFVVAEALTNVARHSEAANARSRSSETTACSSSRSATTASAALTLSWLRPGRPARPVGSVGGTLVLESPPAGPTAITAVLPCG